MKILVILTLFFSFLYAFEYDKLLLKAQAFTFPKIVVLDTLYRKKLNDGQVEIAILYSKQDELDAIFMKKEIDNKFNANISNSELKITLVEFSKLIEKYTAYIALKGSSRMLQTIAAKAQNEKRILFAYDYDDMKNGALVSLSVEERTNLFLNKKQLKNSGVNFNDAIFQIASFR